MDIIFTTRSRHPSEALLISTENTIIVASNELYRVTRKKRKDENCAVV